MTGQSPGPKGALPDATIKYRADGSQEWVARYDSTDDRSAWVHGLVLDGDGAAYVTGAAPRPGGYDFVTIKYRPDGAVDWLSHYDGQDSGGWGLDITLGPNAGIYVSGASEPI